ncbi:MAG: class I SAM-dependent methyltransferase [Bacteroidetes bacterium]|nr:MAG: class I SAM-dependent methyltransferase [Bacteroidota bacterium]
MHLLLEQIFETGKFLSSKNEYIEIHSETSKKQCAFLQKIISSNNLTRSLEVGFAFGTSTLAITEAVATNGGSHVVIDKFQHEHWKGIGLDLIGQAGLGNKLEFHEAFCYVVLPQLLANERSFDFAYVDSTKQFDWLLVDFFYIDKLLDVGGIIVFDDVKFPGIRKLLRYLAQFPNYKVLETFPSNAAPSIRQKRLSMLKSLPYSAAYLREDILKTDFELGVNGACVALQKTASDTRHWSWHVPF